MNNDKIQSEDFIKEIIKTEGKGTIKIAISPDSEIDQETTGIVCNHAYSILTYKTKDDIKLIKVRNPWGSQEWKGDWSPTSDKWTKELIDYFGEIKPNKGQFYIDIDNYFRYYQTSTFCYLLFGANIRLYHFNDQLYFKSPLVFNIRIEDKAETACTIIFNHWRYNRDIQNPIPPFSIILSKYDDHFNITHLYAVGTGEDNCSLIETLDPGNYIYL